MGVLPRRIQEIFRYADVLKREAGMAQGVVRVEVEGVFLAQYLDRQRKKDLQRRQALLIELAAIEEFWNLPRTKEPKRRPKRQQQDQGQPEG